MASVKLLGRYSIVTSLGAYVGYSRAVEEYFVNYVGIVNELSSRPRLIILWDVNI